MLKLLSMDFYKASDRGIGRLLIKLEPFGIRGRLQLWIERFLVKGHFT